MSFRHLLATAAFAAALLPAAASEASQRAIVVLQNGSRMEVERAWQEGESYRLLLPSGGTIRIPADHVKRVSRRAADAPLSKSRVAVARQGDGASASTSATVRMPGPGAHDGASRPAPGGLNQRPERLRNASGLTPQTLPKDLPAPPPGGMLLPAGGLQPASTRANAAMLERAGIEPSTTNVVPNELEEGTQSPTVRPQRGMMQHVLKRMRTAGSPTPQLRHR